MRATQPPDHGGNGYPDGDKKRRSRGQRVAIAGAVVSLLLAVAVLGAMWQGIFTGFSSIPVFTQSGAPQNRQDEAATRTDAPSPTDTPSPTSTPTLPSIAAGSWPAYLGGSARSGFNAAETELTPPAVTQLELRWRLHAGGGIFSQPVAANGLVYWGSWDGYEHATAASNGAPVWATYLGTTIATQCTSQPVGVTSTAAIGSIYLQGTPTLVDFVGGGDAQMYALDALTGKIIWQTRLGSSPSSFIWDSPAFYKGSVYIGLSSFGDCPLVQGRIFQLNAATGVVQHVFDVVPKGCTGGGVWGSVSISAETGLLFFGTGNGGQCSQSEPYAEAVVALRVANLSLAGSWQMPESQEVDDSDFGSTPTLFTAALGGAAHQMLGIPNKNGLYYAFEQTAVTKGPIWTTRIADGGDCPECGSGETVPGAWDGTTLYAVGSNTSSDGMKCLGTLRALVPSTGHIRWTTCLTTGAMLGALMLVPGVAMLTSGATLSIVATQGASAGKQLFTFSDPQAKSAWFASPVSVSNGTIYFGNSAGYLYAFGLRMAARQQ